METSVLVAVLDLHFEKIFLKLQLGCWFVLFMLYFAVFISHLIESLGISLNNKSNANNYFRLTLYLLGDPLDVWVGDVCLHNEWKYFEMFF